MSFVHVKKKKSFNEYQQEKIANELAFSKIENFKLKQNVKQMADELAKMKIENAMKGVK